MNCHVYIILVAHGHDALQEVLQIFKQLFVVDVLIHLEQFLNLCHTLRFPARHHGTIHIACNGVEHLLRVQVVNSFLSVSQNGGTIGTNACQFGASPVKDRHEVVANKVNILFAQVLQGFDVVIDVDITISCTGLDGIMHIDALNAGNMHARSSHFILQGTDALTAPNFTGNSIIQSGDYTGDTGDLTNLLQGNGIKLGAIPSQSHFHIVFLLFLTIIALYC
ncbi:hypothetical protein EVA_08989 [gut metagenome]|uniref:Uncharacterized protein n=1 Tax=gut metagenome TaxID=749906 RepID=J9G7R1_9ZZZZ